VLPIVPTCTAVCNAGTPRPWHGIVVALYGGAGIVPLLQLFMLGEGGCWGGGRAGVMDWFTVRVIDAAVMVMV